MGWPCSVVRCGQPSPVAHLPATRTFDVQHRSDAAKSSEVYLRFSHLTLLSIKNYEYFCVQNYELELRLLHNDPDYGAARGVLSGVGIGKNRQIAIVKNP